MAWAIGRKTNILFMKSQDFFGSDSQMHSLIMDNLDRERFEVHVACNRGATGASPSLQALSRLDDLRLRPTDFGANSSFRGWVKGSRGGWGRSFSRE